MATKPLLLYNPDDGETYKVIVSEEDYKRAQTDMNFAQGLLFHGVVTGSVHNETADTEEPEVEDMTLAGVSSKDLVEAEKHVWQYIATIALIASMETHMEDLNHPVKRKHVYQNIANDLNSSGYAVNAAICQSKWKSLISSYKAAVDNKKKTGRGPTRFHFYEQMDTLLGENPNSSCSHTLDTANNSVSEAIVSPSSWTVDNESMNSEDTPLSASYPKKQKLSISTTNLTYYTGLLKQREDAERGKETSRTNGN